LNLLDFYLVRIVQGGCQASIGRCRASGALWLSPSSVRPIEKGAENGSEEKGEEEVEEEGLTFSSFVRRRKNAHVIQLPGCVGRFPSNAFFFCGRSRCKNRRAHVPRGTVILL
jgi:hypothetical protein